MLTKNFQLLPHEIMKIVNVSGEKIPAEYLQNKQLSEIRAVEFTRNGIYHLPLELEKLQNVSLLVVMHNPVEFLTAEIFCMKSLKCLVINNCNLTHLPASFHGLRSLEAVSVADNKIEYVHPNVFSIDIVYLNLSGNLIRRLMIKRSKRQRKLTICIADNPLEMENKGEELGKRGIEKAENCTVVFERYKKEAEEEIIAKIYRISFVKKINNWAEILFNTGKGKIAVVVLLLIPTILLAVLQVLKEMRSNEDEEKGKAKEGS